MNVSDRIIVITGAASGIGKALAHAFKAKGAKLIVCSDLNGDGAETTAKEVGGIAFTTDVGKETDIQHLIETVEKDHGAIDIFCSNAGIGFGGGAEAPNHEWQLIWDVNVMGHVYAARHIIPCMIKRGGGYLLNTSSAAGLLTQLGSAPYAVTKHAARALAEWLAITHGDQGIKVSCLCPQAVRTAMTADNPDGVASVDGMMEPEPVAEACIKAIEDETFLVLPHEEVKEYMQRKANDYDRWIGGMKRLQQQYTS